MPIRYELPRGKVDSGDLFPAKRILLECNHCGLRRFSRPLKLTAINEWYESDSVKGKWGGERRMQWLVEHLMSTVPSGAPELQLRVLDIGCHTGRFLSLLPDSWAKVGVEVNASAAEHARKRLPDAEIITGAFGDGSLSEAPFDVITAWDVVEHLPEIGRDIQRMGNLLVEGGTFMFETGDYSANFARTAGKAWYYYSFPDHAVFLSKQVANDLLRRKGFRVRAISAGPHSHFREKSARELAVARLKAWTVILYTVRGRIHWPHGLVSHLLGKDGTLANPYFPDHMIVSAEKIST